MAVGRIEVTVEANTRTLVRQLTTAGEAGGEGAKEAIDDALGEIGGAGFREALTKIRVQAEDALSGIEAEISVSLRDTSLAEVEEEINSTISGLEAEVSVNVSEEFIDSSS